MAIYHLDFVNQLFLLKKGLDGDRDKGQWKKFTIDSRENELLMVSLNFI
jgi:hypothetical protein